MACCAFALYLLARLLAGLERFGLPLPERFRAAPAGAGDLASAWRPGAAETSRRSWARSPGLWLGSAASLEIVLVMTGVVGGSTALALSTDLPPALGTAAEAAWSICRSLIPLG